MRFFTRSVGCCAYEFINLQFAFDLDPNIKDLKNSAEYIREKVTSPAEPIPTLNEDHVLKPILDK